MILRKLAILDVNNLFGDKLADKIRQALPGTCNEMRLYPT
jgi:hypothetical protein